MQSQDSGAQKKMQVAGCHACGLVQLVDPFEPSDFYTEYSTPTSWKREPQINKLLDKLEELVPKDSKILDVGCNDGRFMRELRDKGWLNLTGIEPTINTLEIARSEGFKVHHESFNYNLAEALLQDAGRWGCVTVRQVLEHVPNLRDFGMALNLVLDLGGLLVIEVPDSRTNFLRRDYALWEEHVNYFTPETLMIFLESHGFEMVTSYESLFSGVCLTLIARKVCQSKSVITARSQPTSSQVRNQVANFQTWANEFESFRVSVHQEISRKAQKAQIILYGVGARSSNFINIMEVTSFISYAIDDQPDKQNLFMPKSGIGVFAQAQAREIYGTKETFYLLGVNAENENTLIEAVDFLRESNVASILPPSPRLLGAWN